MLRMLGMLQGQTSLVATFLFLPKFDHGLRRWALLQFMSIHGGLEIFRAMRMRNDRKTITCPFEGLEVLQAIVWSLLVSFVLVHQPRVVLCEVLVEYLVQRVRLDKVATRRLPLVFDQAHDKLHQGWIEEKFLGVLQVIFHLEEMVRLE